MKWTQFFTGIWIMTRVRINQNCHLFWYISHRAISILWHICQLFQETHSFTQFSVVPDNSYNITAKNKASISLLKQWKIIMKAKEQSSRLWKAPEFYYACSELNERAETLFSKDLSFLPSPTDSWNHTSIWDNVTKTLRLVSYLKDVLKCFSGPGPDAQLLPGSSSYLWELRKWGKS